MATDGEDRFKPKLGKIRSLGDRKAKTYLQRVLHAASLSGPGFRRMGASAFSGSRIGRGGGWGTGAAMRRGRITGRRRVIVKTRIVKLQGQGIGAAKAHLKYIQRDGVTREGEPGQLYDATSGEADGKGFLERSDGDRHQFRFIVSPEDGAELDDLKPFVRGLMAEMERDLDTRLDWVAVDHFNTDNPHSHIVLRGKDELGKDLVIARDYISHGIRERASELLTLELGPVTELQIQQGYAREVDQERFTRLDREILAQAEDGMVDLRQDPKGNFARFKHTLKIGRLQRLERMGLAEPARAKRWRLAAGLETTLRDMGTRGDIIRTMHREMRSAGVERAGADHAIFDPAQPTARIVGRVVARGLSDELNDRHYLIVDGTDGRTHYAEVGELADPGDYKPGAIVAVESKPVEPRRADRTIAEIAEQSGGLYSEALHRAADPRASAEYVRAHVRRLETMRRAGFAERFADGSWAIPEDFLDKARAYEERNRMRQPARLVLMSSVGLDQMGEREGATWLDRQLVSDRPEPLRASGFGREAQDAIERRRRWLLSQGLAQESDGRAVYQRNLLIELRRREVSAAAERLSKELGKSFAEPLDGERIEGVYRRPLRLASGKFAVIEKSKEFTLVPWRSVLERRRGQIVGGVMRGATASFEFGRKRGIGIG
ncbi:conjugal transfer protein TraI [Thalassospira profundimaris]|uniref:Conjugal transfer protein TraI n=1 Tax=Thalassospira profundimaris TaxID=502049 RepID=A0A367WZW8_9PROT|nr:relaxase/mobilization nuclease RlxS [Thalassospira profundimaris]RCK45962.1 conjugal transfer protein TraI [Thalassospira profundimaris]